MLSGQEIARHPADAGLYPLAFHVQERFGTCVGVHLTAAFTAEPAALLSLLDAEEKALCQSMKGARLVEWVGGRVASKLARFGMPGAERPTLRTLGGAPEAGAATSLSISHTPRLAVALASAEPGYRVGVDIEIAERDCKVDLLAERIMSRAELSGQDSSALDIDTVQLLSIKEAVYKALFSLTGAHLPLRKISVHRSEDGGAAFRVLLPGEDICVEAISYPRQEHFLSLARARFASGGIES